jgi:hypothetical protein
LRKLARYLEFFNGQIATRNVAVPGPVVATPDEFWTSLKGALGLTGTLREWDAVHAAPDGLGKIDGVVD